MAANFQSSFIPKETIPGKSGGVSDKSIINFLGVLLLILSILASVGLFVYKGMLSSELEELKSNLALAESSIDKKAVDEIITFNKKLNLIRGVLEKHQASSNFLTVLSSSTVSGVSFDEFRYNYLNTGGLEVNLRGKASNYSTLALQEDVLSGVKEIKSAKFSNLTASDKNLIGFELALSLDPVVSIYNPEIATSTIEDISNISEVDELDLESLDDLSDVELTDLDI